MTAADACLFTVNARVVVAKILSPNISLVLGVSTSAAYLWEFCTVPRGHLTAITVRVGTFMLGMLDALPFLKQGNRAQDAGLDV